MFAGCARSPEAASAKFIAAGKKLKDTGDPARAILEFLNAARATPDNPEVYYQLGLAYLDAGNPTDGVRALRRTLQLAPGHAGAKLRLAQLMAQTNDPAILKDARNRLQDVLRSSPNDPNGLQALGLTEIKLGDAEAGMEHLQLAAATAPRQLGIAITLAQAQLARKDPEAAEAVLRKFVSGSPQSADGHNALADFYFSQRRISDGEGELHRALAIDPKNGPAIQALARLRLAEGNKNEAEQEFKLLSTIEKYRWSYAIFLFQDGRREQAVSEFERLYKAKQNDRQTRTYLVLAYQNRGRLADAKKVLSDALRRNPRDLDAVLQRGELYTGAREYGAAEADLNQVLRAKPDSPEVHYVLARLHRARGETQIYQQEMAKALELNPFLLPVRLEAVRNYISAKNGRDALYLLDSTPESQKRSLDVLVQRNWALWVNGDMAEMRKGIDLARAQSEKPELLVQDGLWKLRAGQTAAARLSLEAALHMNPTDVLALAALGKTFAAGPTAVEKIKEYAATVPRSAAVQHFLGLTLVANGDRAGARRAFEAARTADPSFVQADMALAQVDVLDQKFDDARNRLRRIVASPANTPTAELWLGNLEETKGDHAAAVKEYRKVLEADPANAEALNNLAYALSDKQPDEALQYAQKAVELRPDNPAYSDTLGWILYKKGIYSNAVDYLERAGTAKGSAVWKYHLAMAYARAGQTAKGKSMLAVALRQDPNRPEAKDAQAVLRGAY